MADNTLFTSEWLRCPKVWIVQLLQLKSRFRRSRWHPGLRSPAGPSTASCPSPRGKRRNWWGRLKDDKLDVSNKGGPPANSVPFETSKLTPQMFFCFQSKSRKWFFGLYLCWLSLIYDNKVAVSSRRSGIPFVCRYCLPAIQRPNMGLKVTTLQFYT